MRILLMRWINRDSPKYGSIKINSANMDIGYISPDIPEQVSSSYALKNT